MSYCPNIDCPHRERTGKPAEFKDGITVCSDCGASLTEESPEIIELPKPESQLSVRMTFTLGMVVFWKLLFLIPTPGIQLESLGRYGDFITKSIKIFGFSNYLHIGALGIMPYVTAYILVELLALLVPPFKTWRAGGYEGRVKLRRLALVLTLFISLVHGYYIAAGFDSIAEGLFVSKPGLVFRFTVSLTMTAVVFLLVWTSDLVTRKGIGHGLSVLILSGITTRYLIEAYQQLNQMFSESNLSSFVDEAPLYNITVSILFVILALVSLLALISRAESSYRKIPVRLNNDTEVYLPVKFSAAGIAPVSIAFGILPIPPPIFFPTSSPCYQLAYALSPGQIGYYVTFGLIITLIYYFLTRQFYNPRKLTSFFSAMKASPLIPPTISFEKHLSKKLTILAFGGASYLYLVTFLPQFLASIPSVSAVIGGLYSIKMIAIAMDVWGEIKARRGLGKLIKIEEFHDIPKAGYLKSILEAHGIPCFLKCYYHRALYYFFGPHLEISVLVPQEKGPEASELAKQYFG